MLWKIPARNVGAVDRDGLAGHFPGQPVAQAEQRDGQALVGGGFHDADRMAGHGVDHHGHGAEQRDLPPAGSGRRWARRLHGAGEQAGKQGGQGHGGDLDRFLPAVVK